VTWNGGGETQGKSHKIIGRAGSGRGQEEELVSKGQSRFQTSKNRKQRREGRITNDMLKKTTTKRKEKMEKDIGRGEIDEEGRRGGHSWKP